MLKTVTSATLCGAEAFVVVLEVLANEGPTALEFHGLPDGAIREARIRVRSAIREAGFTWPAGQRVLVRVVIADGPLLPTTLDLPAAVGILQALELLSDDQLKRVEGALIVGELGLDGDVRGISGATPIIELANRLGKKVVVVPEANRGEGIDLITSEGTCLRPAASLSGLLNGEFCDVRSMSGYPLPGSRDSNLCLSDIHGLQYQKRALLTAAVGGFSLLINGTPSSGKTMLAKRLPGILPLMTPEEELDVRRVYSVAGLLQGAGRHTSRPYRTPHHTCSLVGMTGSESYSRAGEISLASGGVLYLDELAEFDLDTLEATFDAIDAEEVRVGRAVFPARSQVVGSMYQCPCGFWQAKEANHSCTCSGKDISDYWDRGRTWLNRFDISTLHRQVPYRHLALGAKDGMTSLEARDLVTKARKEVASGDIIWSVTARDALLSICMEDNPDEATLNLLRFAAQIECALCGEDEITEEHLATALPYMAHRWPTARAAALQREAA